MNSFNIRNLPVTEKWNCITHGAGVLFAFFFIPPMIIDAGKINDSIQLLFISFYSAAFFSTFLFSFIFHALTNRKLKNTFRKIDQSCIYFLIAASYQPLVFTYMNNGKGHLLLILVWIFVPPGVASIWLYKSKYSFLMVVVYAIQGLMFLLFYDSFFATMPPGVKKLILEGVIFIVTGITFFLWRRWKYHHAIWHVFILFGNTLLFFSIWKSLVN